MQLSSYISSSIVAMFVCSAAHAQLFVSNSQWQPQLNYVYVYAANLTDDIQVQRRICTSMYLLLLFWLKISIFEKAATANSHSLCGLTCQCLNIYRFVCRNNYTNPYLRINITKPLFLLHFYTNKNFNKKQ